MLDSSAQVQKSASVLSMSIKRPWNVAVPSFFALDWLKLPLAVSNVDSGQGPDASSTPPVPTTAHRRRALLLTTSAHSAHFSLAS